MSFWHSEVLAFFVQFEDPACAYAETVITKFTKFPVSQGAATKFAAFQTVVLLVFTCSAYARAGPSNCTKKAGTSGCQKKNGEKTKTKVGRGYNHRTHKSLTFRLFGHSQRSTAIYPVSAGTFIAIREGDPPRLPHIHKVPHAKSFIIARKLPTMSTL